MPEVLLAMTSGGFGVAVVMTEGGALHGVVTDGDLRRNISNLTSGTAGSFASSNPMTVRPDTLAADALALMNSARITVLLVVDDVQHPVGILHMHDLLRAGVA